MNWKGYITAAIFCLLCSITTHAQDTTSRPKKTKFINNIFNRVISTVTVSKTDSTNKATILNSKSERPNIEFEGKVIRKINIKQLGFEKIFTDTSKVIRYYGTRLLNNLHTDTHDWVISDNLFIKEGERLNHFLIADNERYLRTLEFIQDARIIAKPIAGSKDSVDLEVITKDLFSLTGSIEISNVSRQKIQIAEKNFAGAGQKLQLTSLFDKDRNPSFAYDFLYAKNSIFHSFITTTFGYTRIKDDRQGDEDIKSLYLKLDKPLMSPYSRTAGGFLVGYDKSLNAFQKPDSAFFDYKNRYVDFWSGYNFGVKRLLTDDKSRNRTFAAARFFQTHFKRTPFQIHDGYNPFYNDQKGILGEITFFKQEFYKTNFIYGFGTTEDVPYGYNIAATGGWIKQLDLVRPYLGINANKYIANNRGDFFQAFIKAGGFPNPGKPEDATIIIGGSYYSKLYLENDIKYREYLRFSYTRLFNRLTYEPLRIDNALGIQDFYADSLYGSQRMSIYAETFMFLKYKLFGFQMAPFGFTDASLISSENRSFFTSRFYAGIGGGVRTRNENLIFGTIELRFVWFPKKPQEQNSFRISLRSNLRFRYNSNYVKAPDVIQTNGEDINSFYQ